MIDIKSFLPVIHVTDSTNKAFSAAGQAMGELFTAGCIGSACVNQGYLNKSIVQALSKTCFSILLPMFLCTSIINTVQKYGLSKSSMAVPLIGVAHCIALFVVSKFILLPAFSIEFDTVEGRASAVCCAFGNAGVVPMIFAEALFRNGNDHLLPKAYSQVSLYLVAWSPFFWSFGRNVLLGEDGADNVPPVKKFDMEKLLRIMKGLFPPPVIGVLLGLFLSTIPFLSSLVISKPGRRQAPLQVVFNCCQNFGRACNPLALLVLTSSLALGNNENHATIDDKTRPKNEIPLFHRWSCVSIARFLLSPALMISLLNLTHRIGMIDSVKADPMLWFILMLQSSMPSAQNSVLMLQVAEKTTEASNLAKFLFSMYATAMIPVVILSTIMLEKCGLV